MCQYKDESSARACSLFLEEHSAPWVHPNIVWSTASLFAQISIAILFSAFFILNLKPGKIERKFCAKIFSDQIGVKYFKA